LLFKLLLLLLLLLLRPMLPHAPPPRSPPHAAEHEDLEFEVEEEEEVEDDEGESSHWCSHGCLRHSSAVDLALGSKASMGRRNSANSWASFGGQSYFSVRTSNRPHGFRRDILLRTPLIAHKKK
jgi:hypothetical protein